MNEMENDLESVHVDVLRQATEKLMQIANKQGMYQASWYASSYLKGFAGLCGAYMLEKINKNLDKSEQSKDVIKDIKQLLTFYQNHELPLILATLKTIE